ncbi:acyl-CoA thioesterase [Sphingobacterium faecale]|uniref:Acyl-CoA thioesterase n=1 Tax=Sphingobacterium faecale TaxID=2803775 RepID=A0ABS1R3H7_9SPHI|nr:thioesterase family protein [Sphingobacterium faecale]MBL1408789.1 acyl-CoA thioesterase [Sphingobacterium faecale]
MENNIFYEGQVLWSQIDANRHLRHSAYADFCAQARSNMLKTMGLSLDIFAKEKIGPILFREELIYKKEIHLDEYIKVEVFLTKLNLKNARFSFQHVIYKENGEKAAEVNVDGAWLNLAERKLTDIPAGWYDILKKIPRSADYQEVNV